VSGTASGSSEPVSTWLGRSQTAGGRRGRRGCEVAGVHRSGGERGQSAGVGRTSKSHWVGPSTCPTTSLHHTAPAFRHQHRKLGHDFDLSGSSDVIDDVIVRSAVGHFLLVGNWYQVSNSNRFRDICV